LFNHSILAFIFLTDSLSGIVVCKSSVFVIFEQFTTATTDQELKVNFTGVVNCITLLLLLYIKGMLYSLLIEMSLYPQLEPIS